MLTRLDHRKDALKSQITFWYPQLAPENVIFVNIKIIADNIRKRIV